MSALFATKDKDPTGAVLTVSIPCLACSLPPPAKHFYYFLQSIMLTCFTLVIAQCSAEIYVIVVLLIMRLSD
jgi:hypothetical protein